MASLMGFDANEVSPDQGFEVLPEAMYVAMIVSSEMKATKPKAGKQPGEYLELEFQIIEGEHKDKKITGRLNLVNSNTTAVNIAKAQLSAICHSVGVMQPKDSQDLHRIPLSIKVTVRKRTDPGNEGQLQNEIKSYHSRDDQAKAAAPATTVDPSTGEVTPAAPEAAPWLNK